MCVVSGVLVLSWYPPGMADDNGEPSDDLVPAILDTAHQYNIQVSLQEVVSVLWPSLGISPLLPTGIMSASTKVLGISLGMVNRCQVWCWEWRSNK